MSSDKGAPQIIHGMMGTVPSVAHKYSPFFLQSLSSPP
jgi:hypothetical protein